MLAYFEIIRCLEDYTHGYCRLGSANLFEEILSAYLNITEVSQLVHEINNAETHADFHLLQQPLDHLINFIKKTPPNRPSLPKGQTWYIQHVEAAGYEQQKTGSFFNYAGMCYGMIAMGMQAFFVTQMDIFRNRLFSIHQPTQSHQACLLKQYRSILQYWLIS